MENIQDTREQEIVPNWVLPNLQNEKGEIERIIKDFLLEEPSEENIKRVLAIFETSPLVELSDEEWEALENTDSFHNVRQNHTEDAERITEEYNQELLPENKRNYKNILDGFIQGNEMEAPIIIKNKEGKLHLVSGNTRLMVARALGVRPKVMIGQIA